MNNKKPLKNMKLKKNQFYFILDFEKYQVK